MPELPEVETVRRGLARLIPGKTIVAVQHDTDKSFPNAPADVEVFMLKAAVDSVHRRAKVLIIDLASAYSLVIHLKMTGQLVFVGAELQSQSNSPTPASTVSSALPPAERFGAGHPNDSLIGRLPDRSTRVTISFADGSHLYFNDQRKFGWMRLLPTIEVPNIDFMKKVGPEPLGDDFTSAQFTERIQRRKNTTIKAALLDQTVIAGVGNIYADESLWGAKINPAAKVSSLSAAKLKKLYTELRFVLELSIEKGGSTDRNYVNAEGRKGSYISFARVFRQEGKPCARCGTAIIKSRVAGRGTHTCPKCQKSA